MIDFTERRRDNLDAVIVAHVPYVFDATTYVMPVKLSSEELRAAYVFGQHSDVRQASKPSL